MTTKGINKNILALPPLGDLGYFSYFKVFTTMCWNSAFVSYLLGSHFENNLRRNERCSVVLNRLDFVPDSLH